MRQCMRQQAASGHRRAAVMLPRSLSCCVSLCIVLGFACLVPSPREVWMAARMCRAVLSLGGSMGWCQRKTCSPDRRRMQRGRSEGSRTSICVLSFAGGAGMGSSRGPENPSRPDPSGPEPSRTLPPPLAPERDTLTPHDAVGDCAGDATAAARACGAQGGPFPQKSTPVRNECPATSSSHRPHGRRSYNELSGTRRTHCTGRTHLGDNLHTRGALTRPPKYPPESKRTHSGRRQAQPETARKPRDGGRLNRCGPFTRRRCTWVHG